LKNIENPVYRKIVRYRPNSQNIGIAIIAENNADLKFKSWYNNDISTVGFRETQYSDLAAKAIQVHIMHNNASVIIAINRFE